MLRMFEAEVFIAMPTFLNEPAETQFFTSFNGTSHHGGVNWRPEAVQYLLGTYATALAMSQVLYNLCGIRQGNTEVEKVYRKGVY